MLAFILILGLATGGLASILCPNEVDPLQTIHLPHPTSCSKFLTCVGSNPIEQDCPAGLHWNVEKSYCDYPGAYSCSRGNNSFELEPRSFNATVGASSVCLPEVARCPVNSDPAGTVIFVAHRDCRKFYACVSTQQVELSCPPELYWNARGCFCGYEVEPECDGPAGDVEDAPVEANEEDYEPADEEDQPEQAAEEVPEEYTPVRVRRAADEAGSTTVVEATSTAASTAAATSTAAASTVESTAAASTTASSGSGGSGSGSGGSGSSGPVESGADIRTVSSIVVVAFTAIMSTL